MSAASIEDMLARALETAVREAFVEMLPGARVALQQDHLSGNAIGDAAIVALSGHLCGSLIVLTPRASTVRLARRLAGSLLADDDGRLAENGLLTELEQDAIRELSNRVGCIFAGATSSEGEQLMPTFPIFVCGQDINVAAESDHELLVSLLVDDEVRLEVRVFLSAPRASTSREARIRELEQIRAELCAAEK